MKKKGFTLIELLVVIAIIAMLLAILMPALNKVKKIAQRVVCGTNLKGMGNAQTVYANDFDGQYACQGAGGTHTWTDDTAGWRNPSPPWQTGRNITVGASLYLLVRLADVSPKSFVCPASDQSEFSGKNPLNLDIVELNDFGYHTAATDGTYDAEGPRKCVSYSYHQPYMGGTTGQAGRNRADDTRSAAFAVMADKNPWYDPKLPIAVDGVPSAYTSDTVGLIGQHWVSDYVPTGTITLRQVILVANAQAHEREGQNVMFADGHNSFEKTSDVGIKNDNIYTSNNPANTGASAGSNPFWWRRGVSPSGGYPARSGTSEMPLTAEDSFLVNDFVNIDPFREVR